jgi:hypothetical protein
MESKNNGDRVIEKFNEIQTEILRIGWSGILANYHPDANYQHPDAFRIFQLYKEIYENMHKRLIIDQDTPGVEKIQNAMDNNEPVN